jgi:hypothetical protein
MSNKRHFVLFRTIVDSVISFMAVLLDNSTVHDIALLLCVRTTYCSPLQFRYMSSAITSTYAGGGVFLDGGRGEGRGRGGNGLETSPLSSLQSVSVTNHKTRLSMPIFTLLFRDYSRSRKPVGLARKLSVPFPSSHVSRLLCDIEKQAETKQFFFATCSALKSKHFDLIRQESERSRDEKNCIDCQNSL